MEDQLTRVLGRWEGYAIGTAQRLEAGPQRPTPEVWIELHPRPERVKVCDGCGHVVEGPGAGHDVEERWVRDLPILDAQTHLLVHRCRLACPRCGPKLERLAWLERYARVTTRLAESVARLCAAMPIQQVTRYYGLGWDQTKAHRQGLPGTDAGAGGPVFERLGEAGCQRLKVVAMDMNASYELEVKEHCPQAQIVYDLFHVVMKYGREVIDRVRVDEANRLRHDKPARHAIKGSRWLLLRNAENIRRREDRVKLKELLAANRKLATVYVLKDDLKHLWDYVSVGHAKRFWKSWYSRAIRSRIEPLKAFAKKLKSYLPGILAHCRWPLHTSLLEGINNKIKVIKRMAYGFRDDDYFFLKIRAAFLGNGG